MEAKGGRMSMETLNERRLSLARRALSYVNPLVGELKVLNDKIHTLLDERNRLVNLLILKDNDKEIWRMVVQLGVEYDRLIEQRRTTMIYFSKHFNLALSSVSPLLVSAVENRDGGTEYIRGRKLLRDASMILQSLRGIKVSGLRADILTELLIILDNFKISSGFRELRFEVTRIINSI